MKHGSYTRDRPNKTRLPVADAARDGGWKRGTILRSEAWQSDRRVERIAGVEIELHGTGGNPTRIWVKWVPLDVEVVAEENAT